MFQRIRIEDRDARGTRIKVNSVASILDLGIAVVIIKMEITRDCLQGIFDDQLRDSSNERFLIDLDPGVSQHLPRLLILDLDAWLQQELKRLLEDALNQIICEQRKFRLHLTPLILWSTSPLRLKRG